MARPAKSLVARVLDNSFRPDRYGRLLEPEPLPRRSPFRDERRRDLWQELRAIQRRCQAEPEHLKAHARDFSRIVRCLHGSVPPRWYLERRERRRREIDAVLAAMPVPADESGA